MKFCYFLRTKHFPFVVFNFSIRVTFTRSRKWRTFCSIKFKVISHKSFYLLKSFEKYLLDLLHFKDECEALKMPCRKVVSDLEGFTVHLIDEGGQASWWKSELKEQLESFRTEVKIEGFLHYVLCPFFSITLPSWLSRTVSVSYWWRTSHLRIQWVLNKDSA